MDISASPSFSPARTDGTTLRISQVGKVLRRHLPLIGACTLAASAGAFLYARSVPKTYTAGSAITVEGDKIAIPELQGALHGENAPDPMPWVRTEAQALNARGLIQDVIDKLHLAQDPEFNTALRPPTMLGEARAWVMARLPGVASGPGAGPDETVLTSVSKALSVFQDNRSLVISTTFTAEDPRLAAQVVNTLIAEYIAARADRRAKANRGANDTLVQRIAEAKAGLDNIEQQMRDLRSREDIVALRAGSVGQQQVEELATAAARASVERAQIEATWNHAQTSGKHGSADALAGVLDSPTISRLRDQESMASAKVADLSSRYGASYPGVRSAAADLAAVRSQLGGEVARINASLGTQLRVARDKEADLQRQLAVARTTGVRAQNASAQLEQLQQEATTRRVLYQTLLQREQQTVALPAGTETPDVRVLSAAVPPGTPSGPNTKMIVGAGGLSGAMLGCLLALLRLSSVDGFNGLADVTRSTGLPVLAAIRRALLRRGLVNRVLAVPAGEEAEAMRGLRAKLQFAGRSGAPRCVLFASTLGRGEAVEVAAAFARVVAAQGERVLLVEADLDQPQLARLFGVRSDALLNVLEGGADWRDAALADPRGPLDLLLTDRPQPGAAALMAGVPLQNLLVEARHTYDLVVLSGPSAGAAGTEALALRADVTVLLLDARSGNPAAQAAVARLGRSHGGALTALLVS